LSESTFILLFKNIRVICKGILSSPCLSVFGPPLAALSSSLSFSGIWKVMRFYYIWVWNAETQLCCTFKTFYLLAPQSQSLSLLLECVLLLLLLLYIGGDQICSFGVELFWETIGIWDHHKSKNFDQPESWLTHSLTHSLNEWLSTTIDKKFSFEFPKQISKSIVNWKLYYFECRKKLKIMKTTLECRKKIQMAKKRVFFTLECHGIA
jgi:hypothetical protein